ncbi:MAG TPA: RHS repeat-associated core domain-containing protein [Coriobacteriia bacterium]|nr:RHS repeat-associated core domain-containing protein [Coriobacteriia bacterium]
MIDISADDHRSVCTSVSTPCGTTKVTESIWQGGRVAAERDSDGTLYRYVYAPDNTPLAVERTTPGASAELFSYHTDAAGSVVAITNPTGSVVARYRYDAFGAVTSVAGSDPIATRNPLRYRAYYHDASTGLYYLPARSYDPATARFLSPDPAPPSAGDPLSLNAYAYCEGDPVNSSDPTGAVTDVEWGAWDYYYNHDPATTGDRIDAADRTAQTHAGVNTRRAEAAAREAQARAAAMRERQMQEANRGSAFEFFAALCSMPPASATLITIGGLMVVGGVDLAFAGGVATATFVGAPAGVPTVVGGLLLALIGAGLIVAGATALEAESGLRIPVLSMYGWRE